MLPTINLCGHQVTRLVCGGNPFSGFSHMSPDLDWEMIQYHTMPRLQDTLDECLRNGINTVQTRGDRHMMRMILEHRENGGRIQWIAQTASEFRNISANIGEITRYGPIAIYHHGTHVDNCWHAGEIDRVADIVKTIKDAGYPAGIASHIPEVIEYAEDEGWETDFYLGCFYNLSRKHKKAPAEDNNASRGEQFIDSDPPKMASVLSQVPKPCFGYKILGAGRRCDSEQSLQEAFSFAYENLKPSDATIVGMFQKHKNQVRENASICQDILGEQ
jgi:hypothetical protein